MTRTAPGLLIAALLGSACGSGSAPAKDTNIASDSATTVADASAPEVTRIDAGTPAPAPGTVGDNGAILEGAQISGTGPADRRELPTTVLPGSVPDLVVGKAFLTRSFPNSDRSRLVVEVTNRGSRPYCNIALVGVEYLDSRRSLLATTAKSFVLGSIRKTAANRSALSLLPGERAFGVDQVSIAPETIAHLGVQVEATADEVQPTAAMLHAVSYSVDANNVAITVENAGKRTGRITAVQVVYLDEGGLPLGWTSRPTPVKHDVEAGASVVIADNTTRFLGASSDLYVRVAYTEL